jgi:hypothetical protein
MTQPHPIVIIAFSFAHTAQVRAWPMSVSREERELIGRTLSNLLELGHIAAFSIEPIDELLSIELIDRLRSHCGKAVVNACIAAPRHESATAPVFLMPVWAFDHQADGRVATTARLLGLDLELFADPSLDEDLGAHLPGRNGRWLIHARPLEA